MTLPTHPHASANNLQTGARVALFGMLVNLIFATAKILGGLFGHAYVLIADGIESALDVAGSFVIWGGLKFAARPPDETHPYGHGKAEPIAAALVAFGVLAAAAGLAIQSVREILTPHYGPAPFTLGILIVVIVVKEILFRYVNRIGRRVESTAVQTDAWHHRSDVITSFAAAIGISVALLGGKGYEAADEFAAIVAAAIIVWNAWRLLRPAVNELMDRSPSRELTERIRQIAESVRGVERVEKCFVRKMGYHFYADMHVEVNPQMTVQQSHDIAHEVKDNIRSQIPRVRDVLVHIEPSGQRKR